MQSYNNTRSPRAERIVQMVIDDVKETADKPYIKSHDEEAVEEIKRKEEEMWQAFNEQFATETPSPTTDTGQVLTRETFEEFCDIVWEGREFGRPAREETREQWQQRHDRKRQGYVNDHRRKARKRAKASRKQNR